MFMNKKDKLKSLWRNYLLIGNYMFVWKFVGYCVENRQKYILVEF